MNLDHLPLTLMVGVVVEIIIMCLSGILMCHSPIEHPRLYRLGYILAGTATVIFLLGFSFTKADKTGLAGAYWVLIHAMVLILFFARWVLKQSEGPKPST